MSWLVIICIFIMSSMYTSVGQQKRLHYIIFYIIIKYIYFFVSDQIDGGISLWSL